MKDQVFSIGYRKMALSSRHWASWAIARTAWVLAMRKRSTKIAAGLCVLVFLGAGFVLVTQVLLGKLSGSLTSMGGPQGAVVAGLVPGIVGDTHETLSTFIGSQMYATTILLGVVAGGLVAEDRRTGAFELYFSRPLSVRDYIVGKWLAAAFAPLLTTVVPFVILWLVAIGVSPSEVSRELVGLVVPGLGASLMVVLLLSTTVVGVSALGDRGRTVAIVYVVGFLMLSTASEGLTAIGQGWASYLDPRRNIQTIADALLDVGGVSLTASYLDVRTSTNDSVGFSILAVIAMSAIAMLALLGRLRSEVRG